MASRQRRRVFISTVARDLHATAVASALRRKGHEAVLWYGADFPVLQTGSIFVSQEENYRWETSGPEAEIDHAAFDVVWFRRPSFGILPDDMHEGDRHVAQRACDAYLRGFWRLVAPDAFWVNPLEGGSQASSKPVQLVAARDAGLEIPTTLFSNDPRRIREFLSRYEGRVIYKSHLSATWGRGDGGVAMNLTSRLSLEDLPEDDMLRLSSGIFQEEIAKAYELRVNYFGDFSIAAKITVKGDAERRLDWRGSQDIMRVEPAPPLPAAVDRSCREFMRRLGVVFGCFDFIVTPEGKFVFLEINEKGQFLWLESRNPEIMLLDPFCEFLIHGRREFTWTHSKDSVRYSEVEVEAVEASEKAASLHQKSILGHWVKD